jgi:hypothetical protein
LNPVIAVLKLLNGFSFKEKSLLVSLCALLLVYGGYFLEVLSGGSQPTLAAMLKSMIALVVALVIVHVVLHVVIALDDEEEAADERDRAVRQRAAVAGYNVLFVAVLLIIGRLLVLGARAEGDAGAVAISQVDLANLILGALVLSEMVYYGAQLFWYRRGLS